MPSQDDLRGALRELAHTAQDVPDMPVSRAASSPRTNRTRPVLLAAGILVVLLIAGVVGVGLGVGPDRYRLIPAAGPSRAVPSLTSAAPSATLAPSPATTATPTVAPSTARPGAALTVRPMTSAEITAGTTRCLTAADGLLKKNREGKLRVRYATIQAAVGYPVDGTPQLVLLLEDDGGWFDCSRAGGELWSGKGGDHFAVDRSAAGYELPTISGGTSGPCNSPTAPSIDSAVALKTAPAAVAARVTLRTRGGVRTATISTRNGYVYVTARVSGQAVLGSTTMTVELLDTTGARLRLQPYGTSVTRQLRYVIGPC